VTKYVNRVMERQKIGKPMNNLDSLREFLAHRLGADTHQPDGSLPGTLAAVSIVLRQHLDKTELLIIKRAVSERDHWSGHLALPGGRWETGDANLWETAARETFEEVGIDLLNGGEFLGSLEPVTPRSPLAPQVTVAPFVSIAPREYHIFTPNAETRALLLSQEIQSAFWVPLEVLKETGRSDSFRLIVNDRELSWPAYPSEQGPIWGLTERILTSFLELVE
jgi:8-oxo-dGTP pyrophosphatase MutT (NUDIX family)